MVTFEGVSADQLKQMLQKGFYYQDSKTPYEAVRMGGPCVIVLYKSGKLILQGQQALVLGVEKTLKELGFKEQVTDQYQLFGEKEHGSVIGSDESLKGDTFGGLVVAAVRCDPIQREQLYQHNITDSKLIYDHNIPSMAAAIKRICKYEVRVITPEEYNQGSVTALLNKLHGECINALLPADKIVIDKYPGCDIPVTQETKAELKFIEVAAASILAREKALEQLDILSKKVGFKVPKGSSDVLKALEMAVESDVPINELVKMHFSNVQELLRRKAHNV